MKYETFRQFTQNFPYFRSHSFSYWTNNPHLLRRQLTDWIKEKKITVLKRGVYTLNQNDRTCTLTPYTIASMLYTPSYISLETALSYYQFIPERVTMITSITSKKTQFFSNELGYFKYHHIKSSAYTGFIQLKNESQGACFMATPEKALVDFFYFKLRTLHDYEADVFETSFRLQNCQQLDDPKIQHFAQCFHQNKLNRFVDLFLNIKHKLL